MHTMIYAGYDGQASRLEYGLATASRRYGDGVDIVVVHSPRLGPATSLINSEEARNFVLNRILSTDLAGVRLDLIRYFVLFDVETFHETKGFEFPIELDFKDYKRKGGRFFTEYPVPASWVGRILWSFGIRRRQESVWNKDAIAGGARCATPFDARRPVPVQEIKALSDSIGHCPLGKHLPKWLTDQVVITGRAAAADRNAT